MLPAPPRQANGYRDYGQPELERLAFIRHCRALDMPLADVRQPLGAPGPECGDVKALVDQHLARVRARLASLRALEKQELVAAAQGEACACHAVQGKAPADSERFRKAAAHVVGKPSSVAVSLDQL